MPKTGNLPQKSDLYSSPLPTFYVLESHAENDVVRRAVSRYFIPRNYDRSILRHKIIGSPIIRRIVMNTFGKGRDPQSGGNWRLDGSKTRIEAATNYAFRSSVFNEVVHTFSAVPPTAATVMEAVSNDTGSSIWVSATIAGLNWAMVPLQRYNRARMIKRIDEELQSGSTYSDRYINWAGIDSVAYENWQRAEEHQRLVKSLLDEEHSYLPLANNTSLLPAPGVDS